MQFLSDSQQRRFDQYEAALEAHGYVITSEPIPGSEDLWLGDIETAWQRVEELAAFLRKRHGYRGLSANLLRALHGCLRFPSFNVELGE